MLTGLLPHPWAASLAVARTARTPVLQHPPHIRTREDADFTPEQVQNKRSTAESTTAETESGGVATGTSTSQDPARPIKPVRQAALQASARLTKEAQAKALGLGAGGRASGLLGASLGIAGRKTSADASCHNPARCEHCGSEAHKTEDHTCKHCAGHGARTCPPVCANCNGPHRSDDQSCKLAPRMNKHARCWLVPSHGQAKAVRNQGRIDHQKAIQALATERKEIAASSAAAAGDKGDDDAGVGSSMDMEVTPPGSA
ncbi:unnamed protein product [Tilletia caries]|uniref:Effector protein n=1 Tax=Tilletia caries TaxID=13290 RepID=A0ABN7J0G4_9BASI|nr:unnamed protein product [Tilletia caries]